MSQIKIRIARRTGKFPCPKDAAVQSSVDNLFNLERHPSHVQISSSTAPPLSLSGVTLARSDGQRHCPF